MELEKTLQALESRLNRLEFEIKATLHDYEKYGWVSEPRMNSLKIALLEGEG